MAKAKKSTASKLGNKSKGKAGRPVAKTKVKVGARKSAAKATKTTSPMRGSKLTPNEAGAVLEYKLFVEDSVRNLEDQVNYYIRKGWAPVGGVVVQTGGNFMQSMVRCQD